MDRFTAFAVDQFLRRRLLEFRILDARRSLKHSVYVQIAGVVLTAPAILLLSLVVVLRSSRRLGGASRPNRVRIRPWPAIAGS